MFIDSSAFVALLAGEPDQERVADAIERAKQRTTSGIVRLETVMVLSRQLGITPSKAQQAFDRLIKEGGIAVVPLTDQMSRVAVEAFERFGKGRGSRAQLNLGDCLSYAAAKVNRMPLLFIGDDFAATDIGSALSQPTPVRRQR